MAARVVCGSQPDAAVRSVSVAPSGRETASSSTASLPPGRAEATPAGVTGGVADGVGDVVQGPDRHHHEQRREQGAVRTLVQVGQVGGQHAAPGRVGRDDPDAERITEAARGELYAAAIALGGTITGEHGVGLARRDYLEQQRGPGAMRVMRQIKDALDPHGILNPGRVLR